MIKKVSLVFIAAILGGMIAITGYEKLVLDTPQYTSIQERQKEQAAEVLPASYNNVVPANLDFREVSEIAIQSVVYIESMSESARSSYYYGRPGMAYSSGSGVIVSDDGFIITNNHVVANGDELKVTLSDNRSYAAKVIGTDPTTDIALLKIEENGLPYLTYGDSDGVEIGQWVLAVGNPMNLNFTVTAGIISAKARNMGIIRRGNDLAVESFLQTDAVVNPGNSGGALIDINGRLIGINTAIMSTTGGYQGYSFAVPVNLVKKVVDDLLEFGVAQRAILGIRIGDVTAALAEQENLSVVNGVYVASVNEGSSADDAGIKAGDVIIAIGDREVKNSSELQELVARKRPGDQVSVTYMRGDSEKKVMATLMSTEGTVNVVEPIMETMYEGSVFEEVSDEMKSDLGIEGGVMIKKLGPGKWEEAGMKEGFIITEVDKSTVESVEDLQVIMAHKRNERVVILGVFPDGTKSYYTMDW